jgi:hypothetical protein
VRRSTLALCVTVASAAWPGTAAAAPAWHDGDAGVPASADLRAVAAYRPAGAAADTVIAVGRDTELGQAVVYRLADGYWQQDQIAGVPADSCLASVSVTPQAAYAVGGKGGGCGSGTGALIMRLPVEGGSFASSWQVVDGGAIGPLASISLSGGDGYLSSTAGAIYSLHDGAEPAIAAVDAKPGTAQVGAVAAYGSGGFAVGESAPAPGVRVYNLDSSGATPAPSAASAPPTAVAALGPAAAIAIEGSNGDQRCTASTAPAYLYPADGVWRRTAGDTSFPAGSDLRGVAMSGSATSATEAIAGAVPDGTGGCTGYVWSRTGPAAASGGWIRSAALGEPLTGVAVVASDDIWAVGAHGAVLRYFDKPAPPADDPTPPPGDDPGPPPQQPKPPPPHVTVEQPPPSPRPPTRHGHRHHAKPPRQLMSHVRVKVERGRLIVSFRLSAPARVRIEPRSHGHLVGARRSRVLPKGRARMVVPYRGSRPPGQLRIVVRPLKPANTCSNDKAHRGGSCG